MSPSYLPRADNAAPRRTRTRRSPRALRRTARSGSCVALERVDARGRELVVGERSDERHPRNVVQRIAARHADLEPHDRDLILRAGPAHEETIRAFRKLDVRGARLAREGAQDREDASSSMG